MAPTLFVNSKACAKFLNLKTRSNRLTLSTSLTCQSGICGCSMRISLSVNIGSPARHATHFILYKSVIAKPPTSGRLGETLDQKDYTPRSLTCRWPCTPESVMLTSSRLKVKPEMLSHLHALRFSYMLDFIHRPCRGESSK